MLVSVDKTTKGYAIIVYRRKNYQRPSAFRPKNLLTKRREALKHHISDLLEKMEKLKHELENTKTVNEIDEETLYSRMNNASDDEEDEDMEEAVDTQVGKIELVLLVNHEKKLTNHMNKVSEKDPQFNFAGGFDKKSRCSTNSIRRSLTALGQQ
ncbi:CRM family member 3B [Abeliophyllum distichum]|uniref:CRM family member 3B n=1 Tax=Abeliophyllum distichum TaxID=126358 RepID=A0ABD1QVI2_9LAMI